MPTALVIDGHPHSRSLTAETARRYTQGHGDARLRALRDMQFDIHLRQGYRARMPIEPDLAALREELHEAQRIVIMTPMWWGSVPALLKGFFDRALLPHEEYEYTPLGFPRGLLRGRRGRLFLLADTPRIAFPFYGTPAAAQVTRRTMKFCGVRPFPVTRFLGVKNASPVRIASWLDRAEERGASDGTRDR